MILANMYADVGGASYGNSGFLHDLRAIIALLSNRDEPRLYLTHKLLDWCPRNGEWASVDGGAFRIRAYQIGTVHVEIHPDIALRLNAILHQMQPHAIPANFRTLMPKPPKECQRIEQPLPFAVIDILIKALDSVKRGDLQQSVVTLYHADSGPARAMAEQVFRYLGARQVDSITFQFPFPVFEVLQELMEGAEELGLMRKRAHKFPNLIPLFVDWNDQEIWQGILAKRSGNAQTQTQAQARALALARADAHHRARMRLHGSERARAPVFAPAGRGRRAVGRDFALAGMPQPANLARQRELNANGKPGKLHAKAALVDGQALISSANLTDDAFNRNLELGALLAGQGRAWPAR
jgi:hypothetical protein